MKQLSGLTIRRREMSRTWCVMSASQAAPYRESTEARSSARARLWPFRFLESAELEGGRRTTSRVQPGALAHHSLDRWWPEYRGFACLRSISRGRVGPGITGAQCSTASLAVA